MSHKDEVEQENGEPYDMLWGDEADEAWAVKEKLEDAERPEVGIEK